VTDRYDILIAGGGNAALCAAITAAEKGCRVLIAESAPKDYRGGNSRHTRNLRAMHDAPTATLTESYGEVEYFDDLMRVTKGRTDEDLARQTIRASADCAQWMQKHGVRFQPSLSGTLSLSRTNAFFLGGGKALVNAYYRTAVKLGVDVWYDANVVRIDMQDGFFNGADIVTPSGTKRVEARALIAASGGFQGDIDWLARAWGPAARNFLIRGTPYNKGVVLKELLDRGADAIGDPTQCHCVAIDGRAPKFDGGIATRLDCVPFSIVVNCNGERFYDEGEDVWPKRYAIWGRLVAQQPEQVAYSIIDAKSAELFMPSVYPAITAPSIAELAGKLGLDAARLSATIEDYNAACASGADAKPFQPTTLDGLTTRGLTPAKTNWARTIDTAPFYGYPLRPGVTFTYLGVKVDKRARLAMADGKPSANIWAAGEIMAGSILGEGYLAGFGMTIGTVFGRIAGEEAARHVRN
jgi:tricarballylate dehydrogenase